MAQPGTTDRGTRPWVSLEGIIRAYLDAPWEAPALQAAFNALADRLDVKANKLQGPIRVAITGRMVGLPLFQLLEWLGRDESLRRLEAGRTRLG
jgi:glutamyl-tRNA synthetase